MTEPLPLARLLTAATQVTVRRLNETLATRGYPNLRPADGYALLALGSEGATTSQLGSRLGITKQAAAKIGTRLERAGYLRRSDHPSDARAQLLHRTPRGAELLETAAEVQRQIEQDWARAIGTRKVGEMRAALESVLQQAPHDNPLARLW
jgi:DNA-binding MarR family transcriptional regulator